MKPSYEELELKLIESERYGRQTDITIDNLEMKLAQMAAENAGLKAAAEFATASDMWEELGGNVMRYQYQEWYADRLKSAMQTPATDAFLVEVRAQGVDSAIEHLINKFEGTGRIGVPVMALEWLAKELRKGVQS